MNRLYQTVIVVNREDPLGQSVRHIIKINGEFDGEQFKKEYYSTFRQLPGDLFIYCHTYEAFVENMKRYDESFKKWEEAKMAAKPSKQYNEGFKAGVEMMRDLLCGRYPNSNSVLKAIQGTAEVLIQRVEGEKKDGE